MPRNLAQLVAALLRRSGLAARLDRIEAEINQLTLAKQEGIRNMTDLDNRLTAAVQQNAQYVAAENARDDADEARLTADEAQIAQNAQVVLDLKARLASAQAGQDTTATEAAVEALEATNALLEKRNTPPAPSDAPSTPDTSGQATLTPGGSDMANGTQIAPGASPDDATELSSTPAPTDTPPATPDADPSAPVTQDAPTV